LKGFDGANEIIRMNKRSWTSCILVLGISANMLPLNASADPQHAPAHISYFALACIALICRPGSSLSFASGALLTRRVSKAHSCG